MVFQWHNYCKVITFIYLFFYFFVCTLDIQMSNESIVHLKTVTDIDFSNLVTLGDMKVAAADFDMVHQLEEILLQWYKQIEQVDRTTFLCVCYYRNNR